MAGVPECQCQINVLWEENQVAVECCSLHGAAGVMFIALDRIKQGHKGNVDDDGNVWRMSYGETIAIASEALRVAKGRGEG